MTKNNREFICLIIILPILLYAAFFMSTKIGSQYPNYSVLNKSQLGCSVFYEALKELDYPIERTVDPIKSFDISSIQIAADRNFGHFDISDSDLNKWIKSGGILVYLTPRKIFLNFDELIPEHKGQIEIYELEEGFIVVADVLDLTNQQLLKETTEAYKLLEVIDGFSYNKLYFNESHLFTGVNKKSLWDFIPLEIKFILYQILIALSAYFYYKGKRFGKPIPYYEEEERMENEYLYSAASLYRQAGCWDLMLESYYYDFLKKIGCSDNDWLEYWQKEELPSFNSAKKVYDFMHNIHNNLDEKGAIQIVNILERLKYQAKKRREKHWKRLKK